MNESDLIFDEFEKVFILNDIRYSIWHDSNDGLWITAFGGSHSGRPKNYHVKTPAKAIRKLKRIGAIA